LDVDLETPFMVVPDSRSWGVSLSGRNLDVDLLPLILAFSFDGPLPLAWTCAGLDDLDLSLDFSLTFNLS
jgi:hypothetical protein